MREGEVEERRRSGLMTVIIYNNISCWHTNSMRKDAIFWFVMLCAQNDACSSCLLRTQSYIVCESSIEVESAELIIEVYKEVDRVVTIHDAGNTVLGRRLYMANAGDSTSYICIYKPPVTVQWGID